jgi:hypothetical protein
LNFTFGFRIVLSPNYWLINLIRVSIIRGVTLTRFYDFIQVVLIKRKLLLKIIIILSIINLLEKQKLKQNNYSEQKINMDYLT